MPQRIIDFHMHLMNEQTFADGLKKLMDRAYPGNWSAYVSRYSTADQLIGLLDESNIDYAVFLAEYSPGVSHLYTNEELSEMCRQSPRFIPFANINPHFMPDLVKTFEYCVQNLGCRGIKLLPSYQNWYPLEPRMYKLYDAAQEMQIPLSFHTGSSVFSGTRLRYSDPIFLDDIAVDFPRLTIVQAHSGRGFFYDRAFFLARLHENIYMEISGLPPKNLLKYFPDFEKNADKIIFGTDWPSTGALKQIIESISALPLAQETKEKIFWKNAARVLNLKL